MKNMTLENIAAACGGSLYMEQAGLSAACHKASGDSAGGGGLSGTQREASCVVIDSRKLEPGGVFVAARGERVDGHDFIPQAAEKGALGIVCEKPPKGGEAPYILVDDSFKALRDIAEYYRRQLTIPVIGITGSVGKTSTKEMIAGVLSQGFQTLKTEGNFNNEIGLPLTVLRIRPEHEAAVVEMGISDFGEMHRLSRIAHPDICVMTNIGQCHLENLGSREGILRAKSEIFDFMNPDGHIFVNGDDDMLLTVKARGKNRPVRFGMDPANDVYASGVENRGLLGSRAVIHMDTWAFPVDIPLPGAHMVYNALAAAAVGKCLGLTREQIRSGIAKVAAVNGRSHVISLPSYTVIDDCYNANPVSMRAALDLLSTAFSRKAAILGDMFELGEKEREMHGGIGAYAVDKAIDVIVCVGELSRSMYEEACRRRGNEAGIYWFRTRDEMLGKLPGILRQGDSVLVKASHGMRFERVVELLQNGFR